jgi:hypothetical protein
MTEPILAIVIKAGLLLSALMSVGLVFATLTLKLLSASVPNAMIRLTACLTALMGSIILLYLLFRLGIEFDHNAILFVIYEPVSMAILLQIFCAIVLLFIGYKRFISLIFASLILIGFVVNGHISTKANGWTWLGALHLIFVSWLMGGFYILKEEIKKNEIYGLLKTFSDQALVVVLGLFSSGFIINIVMLGFNIDLNSQ